MKTFLLFIFLFLLSCSNPLGGEKRVYICGDHPCVNKKEVEEYFNNNISIEVYTIVSDKQKHKKDSFTRQYVNPNSIKLCLVF